jgi:hypothetical protein
MFWMFVYWVPYRDEGKLLRHCTISRTAEPSEKGPIAGRFVQDGLLAAKLTLTLENFDRDCFYWDGLTFVSEKMRDAMALDPSNIQYFDVDASGSAPLPRSKNYRIMHVPVTEDLSDLKNSDYFCHHSSDGSVRPSGIPLSLLFRRNAEPTHEVFYDKFFKIIYCTDGFALRILKAGCSGAFFFDPSHPSGSDTRLRTLRGVEKITKWTSKVFRTKLIRELA